METPSILKDIKFAQEEAKLKERTRILEIVRGMREDATAHPVRRGAAGNFAEIKDYNEGYDHALEALATRIEKDI